MIPGVSRCSMVFKIVPWCSTLSQGVPHCHRVLRIVPGVPHCPMVFHIVPGCSELSQGVTHCPREFQIVIWCSKLSYSVPSCPRVYQIVKRFFILSHICVPHWPNVFQIVPGCFKLPQGVFQYVSCVFSMFPGVTGFSRFEKMFDGCQNTPRGYQGEGGCEQIAPLYPTGQTSLNQIYSSPPLSNLPISLPVKASICSIIQEHLTFMRFLQPFLNLIPSSCIV